MMFHMKQMNDEMTVFDWIDLGVQRGFCSPVVCETHEGLPLTIEEETEFEEGFDPCLHAVRILPPS